MQHQYNQQLSRDWQILLNQSETVSVTAVTKNTAPNVSIPVLSEAICDTDHRLNCIHCVSLGFRRGADEVFALLGSYAAFVGPLFKSQAVQETSADNYQHALRNNPEERRPVLYTVFTRAVESESESESESEGIFRWSRSRKKFSDSDSDLSLKS
jgi:hypothetical protein